MGEADEIRSFFDGTNSLLVTFNDLLTRLTKTPENSLGDVVSAGKLPKLPPPKYKKVKKWLLENPDKANWSNRRIAEAIGDVSYVLVGQVKNEIS